MSQELFRNFQKAENEAFLRILVFNIPVKDLANTILSYIPDRIISFAAGCERHTIVTERGHVFQGILGVFRHKKSDIRVIAMRHGVHYLLTRSGDLLDLNLAQTDKVYNRRYAVERCKKTPVSRKFNSRDATLIIHNNGQIFLQEASGYLWIPIVDHEVGVDSLQVSN